MATRWCISFKFGHQVEPLALITHSATMVADFTAIWNHLRRCFPFLYFYPFFALSYFLCLFVDYLSHGNICPGGSGISIKVFQVPFGNLFHICPLYILLLSCLNFSIYFFLQLLSTKHLFLLFLRCLFQNTKF